MSTIADFRSDTLTKPTPAMREAMARAEVGDDVFGEDPTVQRLEADAARLLGQEAALFVPSGTMANQIAIHVHCRPGDELVCEERSHAFFFEGGSAARLSGTQARTVASANGFPSVAQLEAAIRPMNDHYPRTRLFVLENTHNMAGGRVLAPAALREIVSLAKRTGVLLHVDGARLANAAVALGCPMADLALGVDSVTLCLSKGLGAPVGSVVAGSSAFIKEARRARKAFGGGMRQVGVLAAAALIALHEGPKLLLRDHRHARTMADALSKLPGIQLDPHLVETNIVIATIVGREAQDLIAFLAEREIKALVVGPARVRFVTHRDVEDEHVARCIGAVTLWARGGT